MDLQLPRDNPGASRDHEAGEWVVRLCRAVRETLDAERVIAWLYDAPGQTVSPFATDTPGEPSLLEAWADTPLDTFPFACTVLLESRPVEVSDAQNDERVPPELAADLRHRLGALRAAARGPARSAWSRSSPASAADRPELHSLLPLARGRRSAGSRAGTSPTGSGARPSSCSS